MWCLLIFEMNNDAIFCLPATVACAFTSAVVFHHIGHRPPCFQVNPGLIYRSIPELENSLWFLWGFFFFTPNSLHWNWCQVFGRFTPWNIKSQNTKMFFWPRDMCQGPGRCMCGCVHTSRFLFSRNSLSPPLKTFSNKYDGYEWFFVNKDSFFSFANTLSVSICVELHMGAASLKNHQHGSISQPCDPCHICPTGLSMENDELTGTVRKP